MARLAVARATAVVLLLLAALCHLPGTIALSPEETAGLQGMCDLNHATLRRASEAICAALEAGRDPCGLSGLFCDEDGHARFL